MRSTARGLIRLIAASNLSITVFVTVLPATEPDLQKNPLSAIEPRAQHGVHHISSTPMGNVDTEAYANSTALWHAPFTAGRAAPPALGHSLWAYNVPTFTQVTALRAAPLDGRRSTPNSDASAIKTNSQSLLDCASTRLPVGMPIFEPNAQRYLDALRQANWTLQHPDEDFHSIRAREHLAYGFELLRRGAVHSAQHEFLDALACVAAANDALYGETTCSAALARAFQALDECEDFYPFLRHPMALPLVPRAAERHVTPAGRLVAERQLDPSSATQLYYKTACDDLSRALKDSRPGAAALSGLAQTLQAQADSGLRSVAPTHARSMALLMAAHEIAPEDYRVSNELGVRYARLDALAWAELMLKRSLIAHECAEAWHNLGHVWQAMGKDKLASHAHQRSHQLQSRGFSDLARHVRVVPFEDFETLELTTENEPSLMANHPEALTESQPSAAAQVNWLKNAISLNALTNRQQPDQSESRHR